MKRLLLPALLAGYGVSAWSMPVAPLAQDSVTQQASQSGAPFDILAPEVRDGIEQERAAEAALLKIRQAEEAVKQSAAQGGGVADEETLEALNEAHMAFLDVSTPEQNQIMYGAAGFIPAGYDPETNVLDMIHEASLVSGMACDPDPASDVVIRVHTSPKAFPVGQYLEATYPEGGGLGPVPISSAGWTHDVNGKLKLFSTPAGCYHGVVPIANASSARYGHSPMPHALFFRGLLYAIHGTMEEGQLGHTASHGCVRVSRANAAQLYGEVETVGASNTYVIIAR